MKLLDIIKKVFKLIDEYQNIKEEPMEILKENLLNIFRGVDEGVFNDENEFHVYVSVNRDYKSRLINRYDLHIDHKTGEFTRDHSIHLSVFTNSELHINRVDNIYAGGEPNPYLNDNYHLSRSEYDELITIFEKLLKKQKDAEDESIKFFESFYE